MRSSAVLPQHVTTRILSRVGGFTRRAVYSNGRHVGYTTSRLGLHQGFTGARNEQIEVPPENGDKGFTYLSDAVVAVAQAADRA